MVTNATGTILDDADFYPFGGERVVVSTSGNAYKFTGKERDVETGLDNFEARYYSSQFGRFQSADWSAIPVPVPYADLGNPQTLNLYAYVKNNPLNLTDPTGHLATGQIGSSEGMTINFRMRPGDSVYGCMPFCDSFSSVNSEAEQQQAKPMSLSSEGLDFIKSYEGPPSLTPYPDQAGNQTIGYGHKILPGESFTKITGKEAIKLLLADVSSTVSAVNKALKVQVSQNQFDALVSLTFNAGSIAVGRTSTIIKNINNSRAVTQANFIAWNKVKDKKTGSLVPSRGLTNRRLDEYEMFSSGDYERNH